MGPDDQRVNALGSLLVALAKRSAFNQLRTIEQLGYMVFLTSWTNETIRSVVRPHLTRASEKGCR